MRTIKDNLITANRLLREKEVSKHLQACKLVFFDLNSIQGFDKDVLHAIAYYHQYLLERHQDIRKVGIWVKIKTYWRSFFSKKKVYFYLNKCSDKKFGDGDLYLKQIFLSIRKAL